MSASSKCEQVMRRLNHRPPSRGTRSDQLEMPRTCNDVQANILLACRAGSFDIGGCIPTPEIVVLADDQALWNP
jgi:hypothetical protein